MRRMCHNPFLMILTFLDSIFPGVGIIPAPALLVHYVLTDLANRHHWDEMLDKATRIECVDEVSDLEATFTPEFVFLMTC